MIYKGVNITDDVVPDKKTATITVLEGSTTDPWMLFLYALKAPATPDKYIQRLTKFLNFFQGTKEEKARAFAAKASMPKQYCYQNRYQNL